MAQFFCKWIYTAAGDAAGLSRRLNQLAARGWELEPESDGTAWFGRFRKTARTELRYDAVTAPLLRERGELERQVEKRRQNGWEPVGTINGIDVYASRPCSAAQPMQTGRKRDSVGRGVLFLAVTAALFLFGGAVTGAERWYLSNLGVVYALCRVVLPLVATGTVLWLLALLAGKEGQIPTAGSVLLSLGKCAVQLLAGSAAAALALDRLTGWLEALLLFALTAAVVFTMLRRFGGVERIPKRLCAGTLLVMLWAALVLEPWLPAGEVQTAAGGSIARNVSDVVSAEELSLEVSELEFAEYQADGSLLVRRVNYTERWKEGWYSCVVCRCALPQLAAQVEKDCRREYPEGKVQREGTVVRIFQDSLGTDWSTVSLPQAE